MAFLNNWVLTLITFVPFLGSIIVLLMPKDNTNLIKRFSIIWSLSPLVLASWLAVDYWMGHVATGAGGMAYEVSIPWIPALGVNYHVGADGISVPLIWLTALLTTLGLYYSARTINKRVKEFFALFLFLSTGMFGVFM